MGYQKSGSFGSSSFGSSNFKKDKGVENASIITMIKDVDLMILRTVESKFTSRKSGCLAKNNGKLPLLPHKYKIVFHTGTIVTRIDPFDNNVNGFILEPFNLLLDGTRHYHEHEVVDVIGSVVAIGDVVPVQSVVGHKIRRTVVIEDAESNQLDCIFWENWATMWDEYAQKRNKLSHLVFILQLGKVKYWDGTPAIHNALLGKKCSSIVMSLKFLLSNNSLDFSFVKELPEYDESQFKIEVFTPQEPVVTIAEFFHGVVKKMVASIHKSEHKTGCIAYAMIHRLYNENGWAYTACMECNRNVDVVESKASSSSSKNQVTIYCEEHGGSGCIQSPPSSLLPPWKNPSIVTTGS
ncbi:replication protein A 70 kDa DNA-binding subunit B [Tanacetum coccineum]